ncbi:unnamed protein product [Leuciscus chuanchicus]
MPSCFRETEPLSPLDEHELITALRAGRWWAIMEVEDRLRSSFEKNGCGLTSGHWGIVEAPQGAQAPARYQQGEPVPAQSPVGAPMPDGSPQGIPVPKALVTTVSSEEAPVPALSSEEAPMYAGSPEEAPVPARSPFRRKVRIPYNVPTTSPEEVPVPNSSQEEAPVPTASPEETPVPTTSSEEAPLPASSQEEAPMSTASPRSTFNSLVTDFKHIEEEKAEFRRKLQTWFPGIEAFSKPRESLHLSEWRRICVNFNILEQRTRGLALQEVILLLTQRQEHLHHSYDQLTLNQRWTSSP